MLAFTAVAFVSAEMSTRYNVDIMQRTGSANLPLHGGRVPAWLSSRMAALGRAGGRCPYGCIIGIRGRSHSRRSFMISPW